MVARSLSLVITMTAELLDEFTLMEPKLADDGLAVRWATAGEAERLSAVNKNRTAKHTPSLSRICVTSFTRN